MLFERSNVTGQCGHFFLSSSASAFSSSSFSISTHHHLDLRGQGVLATPAETGRISPFAICRPPLLVRSRRRRRRVRKKSWHLRGSFLSIKMAQQAHVPKFGHWESDGNVPYTQYFDNARKGKNGGKMINPNDPQQNPDVFSEDVAAVRASPLRTATDFEIPRPKHERRASREEGDARRLTDSPARYEAVGQKPGADASQQRHGERLNSNDSHKRTSRMSVGSDRSIEHSPLHPHYQAKSASKGGVSSPTWERKGSSEGSQGFAPSTPGRSKLRPASRGEETADKGSTVPKFGDWDESNPSSSDGYTHIFNKVREEKHVGEAKVPIIKTDPVYYDGQRQEGGNYESLSCSCFGWCRK